MLFLIVRNSNTFTMGIVAMRGKLSTDRVSMPDNNNFAVKRALDREYRGRDFRMDARDQRLELRQRTGPFSRNNQNTKRFETINPSESNELLRR